MGAKTMTLFFRLKTFSLLAAQSNREYFLKINITEMQNIITLQTLLGNSNIGRGGGLVVSVLAFYSDIPSLNPAGFFNFLYEKMRIAERVLDIY